MLVANWPSRIGTLNVKAGEFVLLGKTLFNLTEPVFTVVMSVSPTDRAKLSPGMIVKVNFNAGESILDGKISELDDSPTVDAQGNSTYEGKVLVASDLESVDGAKVSIDVTLEKKTMFSPSLLLQCCGHLTPTKYELSTIKEPSPE